MSIELMTAVWNRAEVSGSDLMVLLALADWANDEGKCWPSVTRLAAKARISDRTCFRVLANLEGLGLLDREERTGRSSLYTVRAEPLPDCQGCESVTPDSGDTEPLPPVADRTVTEPPTDSSLRSESGGLVKASTSAFRRSGTGARGTRLPDDWMPSPAEVAWSREQGFPDAWAARVTESFCDYWHAKPGAAGRKLDWAATWRNWLRREGERLNHQRPSTTDQRVSEGLRLVDRMSALDRAEGQT